MSWSSKIYMRRPTLAFPARASPDSNLPSPLVCDAVPVR